MIDGDEAARAGGRAVLGVAGSRPPPVRRAAGCAATSDAFPGSGGGVRVATIPRRGKSHEGGLPRGKAARSEPGGTFVVVQIAPPGAGVAELSVAAAARGALLASWVRHDVAALPPGEAPLLLHAAGGDRGALRAGLAALRSELAARGRGALAASSAPFAGLCPLPDALGQARYGLALLRAGLVRGPFADWDGGDLGLYRALYPLWGAPTTEEFVRATLGDLLDSDAELVENVLKTVLTYMRQGGYVAGTAAELGVHRNTVTYRLHLLDLRTGLSPRNPAQLQSLYLAALFWTLPPPPCLAALRAG